MPSASIRASTGISGSSISRNSRSRPSSCSDRASGSRTASADSASRPARWTGSSSFGGGRTRSSRSATTSAIDCERSAAFRTYAAIWVSKSTGVTGAGGSAAKRGTRIGFASWATIGMSRASTMRRRPSAASAPEPDDHPAVPARDGKRLRGAAPRARVVGHDRRADRRTARRASPRRPAGRAGVEDLDQRRVVDRRRRGRSAGRRSVWRGDRRRPASGAAGRAVAGAARRRAARAPAARPCRSRATAAGLRRRASPPGSAAPSPSPPAAPCRPAPPPTVPPVDDLAQRLDLVDGALAGHRRQALDQRPELVLAEEADHRLAVVVRQSRGIEVQVITGMLAHDRRQVLAAGRPPRGAR